MLPTGARVSIIGKSLNRLELTPEAYNAYKKAGYALVLWYYDGVYQISIPGYHPWYYIYYEDDLVPIKTEQDKIE